MTYKDDRLRDKHGRYKRHPTTNTRRLMTVSEWNMLQEMREGKIVPVKKESVIQNNIQIVDVKLKTVN